MSKSTKNCQILLKRTKASVSYVKVPFSPYIQEKTGEVVQEKITLTLCSGTNKKTFTSQLMLKL